jgi:hypothetical protein
VGTAQLKRGAVGTLQLKRSAVTSNKVKKESVSCSSGEKAIAGGVSTGSQSPDIHLRESKPSNNGSEPGAGDAFSSWTTALYNAPGGAGATTFRGLGWSA